jgi:uncharacterized protein
MHARSFLLIPALALLAAGCGGGAANNQATATGAARADVPAPGPGAGDPDAVAAARELLRATNFEQQLPAMTDQMSNTIMNQMMAQARADGRPLTPRMEAELRRIMVEENRTTMTGARTAMAEDAAQIYARYFTADEIRELTRLQTAPVMQKMQRVAPQFMSEMAQMGMRASAARQPEIRQRVTAALERIRAEEGN